MEFTRENLLKAIEEIDSQPELKKRRNSSTYDLIIDGKRYPPILALSVANQLNGGKELYLKDFNNNTEKPFKILKDLKFEILTKIISMKNEFKTWLKKSFKDTSGASSSYVRALDLLSESYVENEIISTKSLFEITDIEIIEKLYREALIIQKDKSSYIYRSDKKSYGDDGYFSASLNKYKEFLIYKNADVEEVEKDNETFSYKTFHEKTEEAGLIFSEKMVARFVASLCTKPFVICSGLSGSGKTKLAQAFVRWISESEMQYKIIPVGADWTNREPLLGYPNAIETEKYVVPENGALELILNAIENQNKPYFLILDEMNLSHVERYFADFLSAMESGEPISLHAIDNENLEIPKEITLPKNLFIIGTVNIDETTYMFSPKVLDRANTLEFKVSEEDLKEYFNSKTPLNMEVLDKEGISMADDFIAIATDKTEKDFADIKDELILFFNELKKNGAEFGYRTASEIGRLTQKLEGLDIKDDDLLDIAIMQKLLPKLHGSRSKLSKVLITLGGLCLKDPKDCENNYFKKIDDIDFRDENIKYKLSFEKIIRMYKSAVDNGFASYAEA